jgi:Protein of unknown function (DUF2281)
MNSQPPSSIQTQLLQILSILPEIRQQELLDFALFLHQQELTHQQQNTEMMTLKAEFAEADQAMAELILPGSAARLEEEDQA